jgi:hypothetical protein
VNGNIQGWGHSYPAQFHRSLHQFLLSLTESIARERNSHHFYQEVAIMKNLASNIPVHTFSSLLLATGMMLLPGTAMAGQGMSPTSSSSGSQGSVPEVQSHTSSGADVQWSDQLKKERDQAEQSRDQAKQDRDAAKQARDQALQAGAGSEKQASGMQAIQGQSSSSKMGSASGNQETDQLVQERDKFLKERDALQKETSELRQERDRAMSSIAGGSAMDAVDRNMPTTPRQ